MRKSLLVAGLVIAASLAKATPTGLFLMPIADILKHREGFAFLGLQGTERNVSKGYSYFHAATVGLFDRAEVGYDNDFLGHTTYNVKLQLFDSPKQLPNTALSVGIVNCTGAYREPYVVARHDFKAFRLHAGYWNTQGCGRLMIGSDFSLGNCTGSLEFLSGPSSITWGSLFVPIDGVLPGLGLDIAIGVPSDRREGIQHSALLYYSFKI